jgi:hypothetical protein
MPFVSRRAQLKLSDKETETLTALSQSRSEPAGRVQGLRFYCAIAQETRCRRSQEVWARTDRVSNDA